MYYKAWLAYFVSDAANVVTLRHSKDSGSMVFVQFAMKGSDGAKALMV